MDIENFIESQFSKIENEFNKGDKDYEELNKILSILIQIIDEHDLLAPYYDRYTFLKEKINNKF